MKQFTGFPAKMEFTPIPNLFFGRLLPEIDNMAELKTTLHLFMTLYRKRGYPQFVSHRELLGDAGLMDSLKEAGKSSDEVLREALGMATKRGTFLHLVLDKGEASEDIYLLNNEANRQAVAKIQSGELKLSGFKAVKPADVTAEAPPDIFALYEDNIGILTPMIADELREAEKLYPEGWIRDAIKEAVALNKRSIRYIMRILERWSSEGRTDGTYPRYSKTDSDKYIKGKYGHMVQR